tara:strand:- start:4114 stop:4329 length:216 start_codon:yes stop_codon:yes gene_type:complete
MQLAHAERIELLDALETLDAVMLPFAPHQRPFGTPGKWIDTVMSTYGFGSVPLVQHASVEMPTAASAQLCA